MSLINIKNLTFSYDTNFESIFDNVTIQLDTKWKLGLVGRNGKGKTTLLKLLAGKYDYGGAIQSTAEFEYFPFEIADKSQSVYTIIESINPFYEEWQIVRELNLLDFDDFDFTKPFCAFSGGQQTKIMLAVLFTKDNTFLLIDEPTNHLDAIGRKVLAQYLNKKSTYIIVSHDKRFLDGCIDHVLSINRAGIELISGNLSSYLLKKQRDDESELEQNKILKTEIFNLREASRQTAQWADKAEKAKFGGAAKGKSGLRPDRGFLGAKAAKMSKRAKILQTRMESSAEEKSQLLKNIDKAEDLRLTGEKFFKQRLLNVNNLSVYYGEKKVNSPITFEVLQGERVLLFGKNGCGKTSILKAILKKIDSFNGEIDYNASLKISYVSQDTSHLKGALNDFCRENEVDKTKLITMLTKFGLTSLQCQKNIDEFSEGQKKKLLIAASLCTQANLYIWDEPLNFIDIISREQIKQTILSSDSSMIFIEHDADFFETVATKTVEISNCK